MGGDGFVFWFIKFVKLWLRNMSSGSEMIHVKSIKFDNLGFLWNNIVFS